MNELEQRLQLIRKLGAGGFGEVWMAQDPVRRQQVACKILSTDDANSRIRFRREFSVLQHLDHPGIIKVYDFEQNGRCMYTMDFVEGRNIRDHLASYAWRSEGALDPACNKTKEGLLYTLQLMIQFTDTLGYLHAKSIIHRDLKPENVLFSPKDQHVKILDFGLVRATGFDEFTSQSGMIQGTPSYIAPEQILGREIDPRADLYALGVILFELITGQVPFRGTTVMALLDAHLKQSPPSAATANPMIPYALENLIFRLMAKQPQQRHSSALEVHQQLLDILQEWAKAAAPMRSPPLTSAWPRWRWRLPINS